MKRFNRCVLFCLIILVSACATNKLNPLQNLSGTYIGQVTSVINIPIKTEFSVNDKGVRSGTYVMTERDGVQVSGTLDEFKQEGPYTLLVSWHDKYGSGKLRMLFSQQQRSFKGFWGPHSDGTLMRWDGVKE